MNEGKGKPNADDFRIVITSLEEFATFCAIIRGEDLDVDKFKALIASLSASSKSLAAAVAADAQTKP